MGILEKWISSVKPHQSHLTEEETARLVYPYCGQDVFCDISSKNFRITCFSFSLPPPSHPKKGFKNQHQILHSRNHTTVAQKQQVGSTMSLPANTRHNRLRLPVVKRTGVGAANALTETLDPVRVSAGVGCPSVGNGRGVIDWVPVVELGWLSRRISPSIRSS